ncbi:MAG: beta-galactosidase [Candidatus Omnitrophica bacterium]|nr:beta-galactosidase [Candidatus Omnitrophota bacterium]
MNFFFSHLYNLVFRTRLLLFFLLYPWMGMGALSGASEEYRAAILSDPTLPHRESATHVETFQRALLAENVDVEIVDADQLADAVTLNRTRFDLLILPNASVFPIDARENLLKFLKEGGDMLCAGGYAFDQIVLRHEGQWISQEQFLEDLKRRARNPQEALLPNGGFEKGSEGWRTGQPDRCAIISENAYRGERCARVVNPFTEQGARWEAVLPVEAGEAYLIGASVQAREVLGSGYAYLAVYQYDRDGGLIDFKDFAQVHGNQNWKRYEIPFLEISPNAARVMFYGGLYLASGTLLFDDVTCAAIPKEARINAHFGIPEDGLRVTPDQLTILSPDQPISGSRLSVAANSPLQIDWSFNGNVEGFEATAQLRQNARWIPLIEAADRRGRFSGVAGALVRHYGGPFASSSWVIFGITNRDLFTGEEGEKLLRDVIRLLRAGVFAQPLEMEYAIYNKADDITIGFELENTSPQRREIEAELQYYSPQAYPHNAPIYTTAQSVTIPATAKEKSRFTWSIPDDAPDFIVLRATLRHDGAVVDRIESGFCVYDEATIQRGTQIRFRDNAFELEAPNRSKRRTLLFGTDTYGNMFFSRSYNPWRWFRDLNMMRDYRLDMYENLQFRPSHYNFSETQWKQLDALISLSQRLGLPYMAGLLIGQDVVVDDAALQQQAEMCRQFAARYKHVPGLIYYLNGDFQLRMKDLPDIRRLWNQHLRDKYGSDEELRRAWDPAAPEGTLGTLPVSAVIPSSWYETQARDFYEFKVSLNRRWIHALCEAIRSEDKEHPITSEYYQRPWNGIDLRLTCEEMDASNFGFFAPPKQDIAKLMATVKWNDMRLAGKTINIGEFGVKTHEAWTPERGGRDYHIHRTEQEQLQLFWWITHAALAMDVTKIQNWCWADDPDRVFPWGMAWNNPLRAKPALKLYRNLRFFSDRITRECRRSEVVFVMPDNWRMGAPESLGYTSLMNALEFLLAANVPYDVANESHLPQLLDNPPRLVVMPLAYTLSAESVRTLSQLAAGGACIYLSGDPSTDPSGKRQKERLETLCGVRFQGLNEHPSGLPFPKVISVEAESLENPASLPFYGYSIGKGRVLFCPEPWETFPGHDIFVEEPERTVSEADNLYLSVISRAGIQPSVQIEVESGVWRVLETKSGSNRLLTIFPRSSTPEPAPVVLKFRDSTMRFEAREGFPCAVLLNEKNQALAATGGRQFSLGGREIAYGESPWMLLSLDDKPLEEAEMLLAASLNGGRLRWHSNQVNLNAAIIERRNGEAHRTHSIPLTRARSNWQFASDPNELILIAPEAKLTEGLKILSE